MKVSAKLNNIRIAPRKIRLVTNLIEGLDVADAINQLDTTVKAGIRQIQKLLLSAISNGENNFGIDRNNMYIYGVNVGAGSTLKRWMPKAYGRAGQILKRTSKIELILEERIEGKGRKSREQMEKEKKEKMAERKKMEKEAQEKREQEEKEVKKTETSFTKTTENKEVKNSPAGGEKKGGITSKIFRRKSM